MKISKLFLACVLSGMVGSVFAAPVKLSCVYESYSLDGEPRGEREIVVEFDEKTGDFKYWDFAGTEMTGNNPTIRSSLIQWWSGNGSTKYIINRKTGEFTRNFSDKRYDKKEYGSCVLAGSNTKF
ncbi:hypothetical protein [Acinetobacter baumannii]|uniref:hypothetical protein n=1 Tax=Acinetobacter baumannii TaxID=470 RepID=UPI001129F49F|nr:hypothetical protein [Acinetobacter baumannii]TPT05458.1 hypothetical protein FJU77_08225 [Acinetobacter baumannii]